MDDVEAPPLVRVNVCLSDEKPFGVFGTNGVWGGTGDDGREDGTGEVGLPDFSDAGVEFTTELCVVGFFLDEKGERNIDHSDSNCTDSTSDVRDECSRSAVSISLSMRRSATRMIITVNTRISNYGRVKSQVVVP